MLRTTWRYLFIPAVALLITMWIYDVLNTHLLNPKPEEATSTGQATIGGNFTLTNQYGDTVQATDFRGRLMLVYFGFTHCPDICPTDLTTMTAALSMLDDNETSQIWPIFITIDPKRDTVEQMKRYAENFHPGLQALTGTTEQIISATKAYRVFSEKVTDDTLGEYLMNHSAYMYLMSRDGAYLAHFTHGQTAEELVAGIRKYL